MKSYHETVSTSTRTTSTNASIDLIPVVLALEAVVPRVNSNAISKLLPFVTPLEPILT